MLFSTYIQKNKRIKCVLNVKELKIALFFGLSAFILNKYLPWIKLWRLTPISAYRQYHLLLEPANIIGIQASCLAGPSVGLIIALLAINPSYMPEVDFIVKAARFISIGYLHRKITSPWNALSIPLGIAASLLVHPTLVNYFLFQKLIVYPFWWLGTIVSTLLNFLIYLLFRYSIPQIYQWVYKIDS
jgi:hypothetical protein